jgi:ATP-dependent DNA helicase RecG
MSELLRAILDGESKHLEFKEDYSRTMLKTISAFANYHTGKILLGISDDGELVGVDDPQGLRLRIENAIHDQIHPLPDYKVDQWTIEGKSILIFRISKGDRTPYTVQNKAYRRRDTSTVEVDKFAYNELVLYGRNIGFEELECHREDLRFQKLESYLERVLHISDLDDNVMKTLELMRNNQYNYAAELLADSNTLQDQGFDFICYLDNSMLVIKDRMRLSQISVLDQYEKAMLFYQKHINQGDRIEGAYRRSVEEVPEIAYREAVANAIIHRDYSRQGNNRIEIFEDRIEIVSIGGLPVGITKEEFIEGYFSHVRNRILANVFMRCGIIERMGTGIRRINTAYREISQKPVFEVMENSIRIVLPKQNIEDSKRIGGREAERLSVEEAEAVKYIRSVKGAQRSDIEEILGVKKTKATEILNQLIKKRMVRKVGSGKGTRYYGKS